MSPRVFLPVVLRLALVAAGPFVVLWYFAGPRVAAAGALVVLAVEIGRLSRTIRAGVTDQVTFTPARIHATSWVDRARVDELGHDLQLMGFIPIADREVRTPIMPEGVMRAMTHRGQRMYAVITQTRGPAGALPPTVTVFSSLTDGRTLSTSSMQPDATMALGLESIDSWQIRPDGLARNLVAEHLATREQLLVGRDAAISGDGSFESYAQAQTALFHRQAEQCRAIGVLRALRRLRRWEKYPAKSWVSGRFNVGAPFIAPPVDASRPAHPQSAATGAPAPRRDTVSAPRTPSPSQAPHSPPSLRVDLRPSPTTSATALTSEASAR